MDAGDWVDIENNLYERQDHWAVGARVQLKDIWVDQDGETVYAAEPGDTWVWRWRHVASGQVFHEDSITYHGGEDLCWSTGYCGVVTQWAVVAGLQCMPEDMRVNVETYFNETFLGADNFVPTQFVPEPKISITSNTIHPYVPSRGTPGTITHLPEIEAETTEIAVLVVDDLGCNVPLEDVEVKLESFIVPESGGHLHFAESDIGGTGLFIYEDEFDGVRNKVSGITDETGRFEAEYKADKIGINEEFVAQVENPLTEEQIESDRETLTIVLPGLTPLDPSSEVYTICGTGSVADLTHNRAACGDRESHYLKPNVVEIVEAINEKFKAITGFGLSFNDATLPHGGIFDSGVSNLLDPKRSDPEELFNPELDLRRDDPTRRGDHELHQAHRHGTEIDINRGGSNANDCPQPGNLHCVWEGQDPDDEDYNEAFERFKGMPKWEIIKRLAERDHGGWMAGYAPVRLHLRFQE